MLRRKRGAAGQPVTAWWFPSLRSQPRLCSSIQRISGGRALVGGARDRARRRPGTVGANGWIAGDRRISVLVGRTSRNASGSHRLLHPDTAGPG